MQFKNRAEAGKKLAEVIKEEGLEADLVLAIPRGGLPIGREVANALNARLDVLGVSKISAPANPELALGAVTGDGIYYLNKDIINRTGIQSQYLDETIQIEAQNASKKEKYIRKDKPPEAVEGKNIIIVDDGLATGATAKVALESIRDSNPRKIIFASPVASKNSIKLLQGDADDLIILETPEDFTSVGQFYREFPQLSYEQAHEYLEK